MPISGNLSNQRKGIASVAYNLLNLPDIITFTDGSTISYAYDITGEKRRVVYSTATATMEQPVAASLQSVDGTVAQTQSGSGSVTTTLDYCGSLIFQDYSLNYILLEDDGIWEGLHGGYCFYVRDHLDNVRLVHNQYGACVQTSQYYPFGKMWDDFSWNGSTQPFRFSGKELDKMHGLEWYDFVARMYDPGLGRFTGMDSRAEVDYSTSPYVYCGNNPIIRFDKDGRIWDTVLDAAFVAYDLVDAATQYISTGKVSNTTKAALTADVMAAAIPGLTGTGLAVRASEKAVSKSTEIVKGTEKAIQTARTNRAESIAKGIPEKELGPSGLPKIHNVVKTNLKSAKDAATNNRKVNTKPIKHSSDKGQKEHYHSTRNGEKLRRKR